MGYADTAEHLHILFFSLHKSYHQAAFIYAMFCGFQLMLNIGATEVFFGGIHPPPPKVLRGNVIFEIEIFI